MTEETSPNSPGRLVIFGAGGHAVSVANVARSAGFSIAHFVDKNKIGESLLGISIIGGLADLANPADYCYAIAFGDNAARERLLGELAGPYPGLRFPTLVHASATISYFTSVGEGTVVMPQAVVGPNTTVGRFCILNTQASIDHDCSMADFSSLAPGAVVGGRVRIGVRSAVLLGVMVKHALQIGSDSVLGANSYLDKNLPDNQMAYGTPAKLIRSRQRGDPYLD